MQPFRNWNAELPRMLARQEPEDLHLDYKARDALLPPSMSQQEKRALEVSKDVSAFLNSDGGTIVYGIRETTAGRQRLPVSSFAPQLDGFDPGEISKEDLENLITSNIAYRPGPDLFCITVVDMSGRYVFVVDIAKSYQGAFQAKDKRYYKRFNFKSEPMEHYEVEDVRKRATSPDLRLIFGLTDTWATNVRRTMNFQTQQEEVAIHIGLVNRSQVVAETALVELGVPHRNHSGDIAHTFLLAKERILRIDGQETGGVPWYRCLWTPQNLGPYYTPLFLAVDPEYVVNFPFQIPQATYSSDSKGHALGFIYWRIQAPNMTPKVGSQCLRYRFGFGRLSIEPDTRLVEVGEAAG